jgi:hypothetical protein
MKTETYSAFGDSQPSFLHVTPQELCSQVQKKREPLLAPWPKMCLFPGTVSHSSKIRYPSSQNSLLFSYAQFLPELPAQLTDE